MHLLNFFQTIYWDLLQIFYQSKSIWKVNGRLQFQKKSTHQCTKMLRMVTLCFMAKRFQIHQNCFTWNLVFTLSLRILMKSWPFSFRKDKIKAKTVSKLKCLRERKKLSFTLQMKALVLHFFRTDLGHIFGSNVGNELGVMLRGKGPHKPEFAYDIVPHTLSHDTHRPDWVQYRCRHKGSIAALLSFYFEAQVWRHYNYWTVHELWDI